jgi:hypothetical protein
MFTGALRSGINLHRLGNPGTKAEMFEIPYGLVERACAGAFRIPEAARETSFRSAFANMQRLGVLGEKARTGRGAPLLYGPDEIHRVIFAWELNEVGVAPATVVNIITAFWEPKLKAIFAMAERTVERNEDPENDVIVYAGGVSLRTGAWSEPQDARFPGVPNINRCRLHELPTHMDQWMRMEGEDEPLPRGIVFNLSSRLRAFHRALARANLAAIRAERSEIKPRKRGKGRPRKGK